MNIEIQGLADLADTNAFLRSLWATIRTRCGKCAWSYHPFRDGEKRLIHFGDMDIGVRTVSVTVRYQTRRTVSEVRFGGIEPDSDLGKILAKSVQTALATRAAPQIFSFAVTVSSLRLSLGPYKGEWFSIHPTGKATMQLTMRVRGFDRTDGKNQFLRVLPFVLDTMAVDTNHLFWTATNLDSEPPKVAEQTSSEDREILETNTFIGDEEWIDGMPLIDGCLVLSKTGYTAIERFLAREDLSPNEVAFLRACHHFHVAREQDALVNDRVYPTTSKDLGDGRHELLFEADARLTAAAIFSRRAEEIATTLYLSAVEVASAINAPASTVCGKCGQMQYRISARVVDYVGRHFPEGGNYLENVFQAHYASRSQYLHTGAVLTDHTYHGTTIPRLDPSSNSGATERTNVLLRNLREWIGYALRKQLREGI